MTAGDEVLAMVRQHLKTYHNDHPHDDYRHDDPGRICWPSSA